MPSSQQRVVVVGGGFGGLHAVRGLKRAPVEVTLVDRRNFHLFQPLLYQVATGGLSPANIAAPLRSLVKRQRNAEILLAEATGFDVAARRVFLRDGEIPYDTLVVAAGAGTGYFGRDDWAEFAPGLKTIEDATEIRARILSAFERAERAADPEERRRWLTFVIVGGGPTGCELAGALSEIARHTLKHDFRHIEPEEARIIVVEGGDRILSTYPPELSAKAERALANLGVASRTRTIVTGIAEDHVVVRPRDDVPTGDAGRSADPSAAEFETIPARTILWAAGVQASPLAKALSEATGTPLDRGGRLVVEPDLALPGHPEIFAIGDMARFDHQGGQPLPGIAPVAIQQGKYVAQTIHRRLRGEPVKPFHYRDRGTMATIGRSAAVAQLGRLKFSGFPAWLLWLFVHLLELVTFQNRLLVLIQWAWNYVTFNRSARLITGREVGARDDRG